MIDTASQAWDPVRSSKYSVCGMVKFSDEDQELSGKSWRLDRSGYPRRSVKSKGRVSNSLAHHEVCFRKYGRRPNWEKREVCDHINGDKLDNRRENIRIVSNAENLANKPLPAPRLTKEGSWMVNIRRNGLKAYGTFKTHEQAISFIGEKISEAGGLEYLGVFRESTGKESA